ncbi:MAG: hypothetical protein SYR96_19000 [Actinomycetota bacterium]|nr:hypothetical protein [Actinomycetota bacterium]
MNDRAGHRSYRGPVAENTARIPGPFAITQTHWFLVRDGRVAKHWATRDDLGTATQPGRPPAPVHLWRTVQAERRVVRAANRWAG